MREMAFKTDIEQYAGTIVSASMSSVEGFRIQVNHGSRGIMIVEGEPDPVKVNMAIDGLKAQLEEIANMVSKYGHDFAPDPQRFVKKNEPIKRGDQ